MNFNRNWYLESSDYFHLNLYKLPILSYAVINTFYKFLPKAKSFKSSNYNLELEKLLGIKISNWNFSAIS